MRVSEKKKKQQQQPCGIRSTSAAAAAAAASLGQLNFVRVHAMQSATDNSGVISSSPRVGPDNCRGADDDDNNNNNNNRLGYMPSSYDHANLCFFEAAAAGKSVGKRSGRRMRIGSSQHQQQQRRRSSFGEISDDECQGGGICPSCRLAVNKDTGRLKWCMGGNDIWRTRIRFMLLIPAVILPLGIVIIALSKSTVIGKLSMRQAQQQQQQQQQLPTSGLEDTAGSTPAASLLRDGRYVIPVAKSDIEQSEVAEGALHPDAKTSFLPAESLIASSPASSQRRKRDMNQSQQQQQQQRRQHQQSHGGAGAEEEEERSTTRWHQKAEQPLIQRTASKLLLAGRFTIRNCKQQRKQQRQPRGTKSTSRDEQQAQQAVVADDDDDDNNDKSNSNDDDDDDDDCDEDDEEEEEEEDSDSESEDEEDEDEDEDNNESDEDEEEEEDSSSSSEEVRQGRSRAAFDEGSRSMSYGSEDEEEDDEYLNFWGGNWNEDFIRKSQAKMMLRYMDRTADPCGDFYQFACGNWQKYNPIPDYKAGFDTFETLRESLDLVLKQLLEEPLTGSESAGVVKAKNLFHSCMNYEILEKRGARPLLELLNELGGWPILRNDWDPESFDWLSLVARLKLYNNDILINEWVGPDTENSDKYIIQFDQTTLGLPTKDYFLQAANTIYLRAYKNYLISVAVLLGASHRNAKAQAEELIQFEIQLANITISPHERRNVSELYKRMTVDKLHASIPQIDWHRYLSTVLGRPVNFSEPVVLFTTKYLQDLVELLSRTPRRTVANYVLWRFVQHRVYNLDDRFQEAKQTFYYVLVGREKSPPRWKHCVAQVNANMGMAVGSIFVRKYFDEKSKSDTLAMTHEIQRAFRELLNQSSWLDPMTRRVAGEKVEAMRLRIGYPDFILRPEELDKRYEDVDIHPYRYFENTLNVLRHLTRIEQGRLGRPVNKTVWNAAPAIVNAYNSRNINEIVFPAGILQPPFYHRYFPRCLNYGGIGVVIGHEITHGFDNKGRLFDKYGNLHRWWSKDVLGEFNHRASCLIDQYSHYVVEDVAMAVDGVNTQGENIADNGGIKQAFRAYEKWLSENKNANESLPGVEATGRQLFFLNFAQVWCGSMRPEAMRNKLKTAVHPPGRYRVIGTLSNSKDFAKVFNCPLGSPMNPVKKCLVW